MARRGSKNPRWALKKKREGPKHNWSNDGGGEKRMLNMSREKYFRFDLADILEDTENQDNKDLIAATVTNKAARQSIREAKDYVEELGGDGLEKPIAKDIEKLLDRYSTYR